MMSGLIAYTVGRLELPPTERRRILAWWAATHPHLLSQPQGAADDEACLRLAAAVTRRLDALPMARRAVWLATLRRTLLDPIADLDWTPADADAMLIVLFTSTAWCATMLGIPVPELAPRWVRFDLAPPTPQKIA